MREAAWRQPVRITHSGRPSVGVVSAENPARTRACIWPRPERRVAWITFLTELAELELWQEDAGTARGIPRDADDVKCLALAVRA